MPNLPTEGDTFAKLIHHLQQAQECAALLAHLAGENDRRIRQRAWLGVSEGYKRAQAIVTQLATSNL